MMLKIIETEEGGRKRERPGSWGCGDAFGRMSGRLPLIP